MTLRKKVYRDDYDDRIGTRQQVMTKSTASAKARQQQQGNQQNGVAQATANKGSKSSQKAKGKGDAENGRVKHRTSPSVKSGASNSEVC